MEKDMELVSLQFQTPQDLASFRQVVKSRTVRVDLKELHLVCHCSESDIELAVNHYHAVILERVKRDH
ncbi:MAG TPA: hypothetical protein VGD26_01215 [Chitinophagaceae bacterium]